MGSGKNDRKFIFIRRDCGSVLSEDNRIGTIRSVEGSSTPIGVDCHSCTVWVKGRSALSLSPVLTSWSGATGSNQISNRRFP
ncbi:UNVERIFIED_CONTAM: hypothetical protein Slati_4518200 [Sesamum latifolium]|uniref:Uncharacterized protein n=1 Tax=Sesamum latifolium TaxID=2727402 RepID=A0AAW2SH17_9LAMI